MYGPTSPAVKLVPLSVFFLNMQGDEDGEDENGMYGKKRPGKDRKKRKGERVPDEKQRRQAAPEPSSGGKEGADGTRSVKKQPPRAPRRPEAGGPEPPKSESLIERKGKISKPQKCKYCDSPATKACIWADGRAYIPVCDGHESAAKRRIEKTNRDKVSAIRPIPQGQSTAEQTPITAPVLTPIKTGATRASSGAMGVGNIARYHVPLGPPLRRVTPIGDEEKKKKRRRRKLKGETRDRWIERLAELIV
jgi:hypothetical protein